MTKVTVVAKVTAKSGAIETVKAELMKMIAPTRQENGCLEYRLHQEHDNPAVFIFYENWETPACLEQHVNSTHYMAYVAAVADLIADKSVNKLIEIG